MAGLLTVGETLATVLHNFNTGIHAGCVDSPPGVLQGTVFHVNYNGNAPSGIMHCSGMARHIALFHVCYFTSIIYSVLVTHTQPPGYLKEVKPSSYFNVGCKGHHVWEPTWWSWSWHVPLCTPSAICSYGRSVFPLLPCVCVCAHVCVLPFLLENEVFQDWDHNFLIFEQVCHGACYMVVLEIVCWPAFHKLRILT